MGDIFICWNNVLTRKFTNYGVSVYAFNFVQIKLCSLCCTKVYRAIALLYLHRMKSVGLLSIEAGPARLRLYLVAEDVKSNQKE